MIIAIDIDNTVSDTTEAWFALTETILKEKGITPNRIPGIGITLDAYSIPRGSDLHEYYKQRSREMNLADQIDYEVIFGAENVLQKWYDKGHTLIYISARADALFGDAERTTSRWLANHKIPFHQVICNCEDKGSKMQEIGAEVLVDDNLEYCETALAQGKHAIYFYNPNNTSKQTGQNQNPNIHVAHTWQEIDEHFQKIQKGNL